MSARAASRHLVVLGGGVAGLAAAYAAKTAAAAARTPLRVTLLEASSRLGGWLWSERKDGFLFERGCRGIRPVGNGKAVMRLAEELQLQSRTLISAPSAKVRYLWHQGRMEQVPTSLTAALTSPLTRAAPLWLLRDLTAPGPQRLPSSSSGSSGSGEAAATTAAAPAPPAGASPLAATATDLELLQYADESLASFAGRRFSPFVGEVLLDALMSGVYAGDARQLSVHAVQPWLARMEARHRSIILGVLKEALVKRFGTAPPASAATATAAAEQAAEEEASPFVAACAAASSVSFVDGTQTLADALAARLAAMPDVHVATCTHATGLEPLAAGVRVHVRGAAVATGRIDADAVISALPAAAFASLLPASTCAAAQQACKDIPTVSVAVVSCGWRHSDATATAAAEAAGTEAGTYAPPLLPSQGFGYLVPSGERAAGRSPPVLGMTWDSEVFPGQCAAWAQRVASWPRPHHQAQPQTQLHTQPSPQAPCHPGMWGAGYQLPGTAADLPLALRRSETRVTVMMGGATAPHIPQHTDDQLLALAKQALAQQTGIHAEPSTVNISVARSAIPQYNIGHGQRLQAVGRDVAATFGSRLRLVGNAWKGVGVADAVANAMAAGKAVASDVAAQKL